MRRMEAAQGGGLGMGMARKMRGESVWSCGAGQENGMGLC